MRFTLFSWLLVVAVASGCGETVMVMDDLSVSPDLSLPVDMAMPKPDLLPNPVVDMVMPDLTPPPDLVTRDMTVPADLIMQDMSVVRDLLAPPDLIVLDLVPPPDLVAPPDLVPPPDLVRLPDLVPPPDLYMPPDLVPPPDLVKPPDLVPPPDLSGPQIVDVVVSPNGGLSFAPQNVTIKVNDTVRWTWQGNFHNVVSGVGGAPDNKFCSPNNMNCANAPTSNAGAVYSFKFAQAGNYPYYCAPHVGAGMTGAITVQ